MLPTTWRLLVGQQIFALLDLLKLCLQSLHLGNESTKLAFAICNLLGDDSAPLAQSSKSLVAAHPLGKLNHVHLLLFPLVVVVIDTLSVSSSTVAQLVDKSTGLTSISMN
ncbi:TPA_asm: membrane protein [Mycobacterium phage prophiFSQJ01-1]|nr:TPA_asm: membrane protein [Mycobacterium phage prophiFSQJ01-1]